MKIKRIFQIISYLQYPLMLMALFFAIKPYLNGLEYMVDHPEEMLNSFKNVLIFTGIGISFSTLQDTSKTQNNFSKKILTDPKKGKLAIILMSVLTFSTITLGVVFYFFSTNTKLEELSIGLIILGIGLIVFLKTGIELFENHRSDKN